MVAYRIIHGVQLYLLILCLAQKKLLRFTPVVATNAETVKVTGSLWRRKDNWRAKKGQKKIAGPAEKKVFATLVDLSTTDPLTL